LSEKNKKKGEKIRRGKRQAQRKELNEQKEPIFGRLQCCQMVCFQTKNANLGKFWRVLQ
jgi:hypothetical protein